MVTLPTDPLGVCISTTLAASMVSPFSPQPPFLIGCGALSWRPSSNETPITLMPASNSESNEWPLPYMSNKEPEPLSSPMPNEKRSPQPPWPPPPSPPSPSTRRLAKPLLLPFPAGAASVLLAPAHILTGDTASVSCKPRTFAALSCVYVADDAPSPRPATSSVTTPSNCVLCSSSDGGNKRLPNPPSDNRWASGSGSSSSAVPGW
mmetsp:Transcript_32160/g.80869  ORF Transcript_32160/g.80869 Transcript_32160/m.80869 type:complete len:206 (-) Transcript_32160:1209-1826(-)